VRYIKTSCFWLSGNCNSVELVRYAIQHTHSGWHDATERIEDVSGAGSTKPAHCGMEEDEEQRTGLLHTALAK
jgi:hypothetical protein